MAYFISTSQRVRDTLEETEKRLGFSYSLYLLFIAPVWLTKLLWGMWKQKRKQMNSLWELKKTIPLDQYKEAKKQIKKIQKLKNICTKEDYKILMKQMNSFINESSRDINNLQSLDGIELAKRISEIIEKSEKHQEFLNTFFQKYHIL